MAKRGLNKVQIIGYLGATPQMRYSAQGDAVTTFRVAVNSQWRERDGQLREETEWFRIVAWSAVAENCHTFLDTGSKVYIEGRLKTRKWQDERGQDRYTTELIAKDVIFLDKAKGANEGLDEEDVLEDDEHEESESSVQRYPVTLPAPAISTSNSDGSPGSAPTAQPPISSPPPPTAAAIVQKAAPTRRKGSFEAEDLPL